MIYKLLWGWLRCLRVVILLCSCNMYFHALLFFLFSFSVTLPLLSFSNSVRTVPAHWILSPLVTGAGTLKQTPLFQFPHTLPITAINNAVSLSTPSPTPLHTSHLNANVPFSCIPKGFLWSTGRVFLWVGRKLRLTEVESILPILSTICRKWKFLNIWMGKETHLGRNEDCYCHFLPIVWWYSMDGLNGSSEEVMIYVVIDCLLGWIGMSLQQMKRCEKVVHIYLFTKIFWGVQTTKMFTQVKTELLQ